MATTSFSTLSGEKALFLRILQAGYSAQRHRERNRLIASRPWEFKSMSESEYPSSSDRTPEAPYTSEFGPIIFGPSDLSHSDLVLSTQQRHRNLHQLINDIVSSITTSFRAAQAKRAMLKADLRKAARQEQALKRESLRKCAWLTKLEGNTLDDSDSGSNSSCGSLGRKNSPSIDSRSLSRSSTVFQDADIVCDHS